MISPLDGKRIVITRPLDQAEDLSEQLSALGAVPILFPTIRIVPFEENLILDQVIFELDSYQWIIFTSVNGVSTFLDRLTGLGRDKSVLERMQIAAIGPATARSLTERGVHTHFIPDEYIAEAVAAGIGEVDGQRILLPRAEIARKALVDELEKRGAYVTEIPVYRTLPVEPDPIRLDALHLGVDVVTFTSPSTVRNFSNLLDPPAADLVKRAVIACIGPITAQAVIECGMSPNLVAKEYTTTGLVQALVDFFQPSYGEDDEDISQNN